MAGLTVGRLFAILAAAVAATLFLRLGRAFPWALAGIVGVAVGILVATSLRTGDRIRGFWRR